MLPLTLIHKKWGVVRPNPISSHQIMKNLTTLKLHEIVRCTFSIKSSHNPFTPMSLIVLKISQIPISSQGFIDIQSNLDAFDNKHYLFKIRFSLKDDLSSLCSTIFKSSHHIHLQFLGIFSFINSHKLHVFIRPLGA